MSRTDRRRRSKPPSDLRARFLFDDLEALRVEHAADLAYRISLATFSPIGDERAIDLVTECFTAVNALDLPVVVTGGLVSDFHLGRVLREHDDIDLFVLAEDEQRVMTSLSASNQFRLPDRSAKHVEQARYDLQFRDGPMLDLSMVGLSGRRGSDWGDKVLFGLDGLEVRRRELPWNGRSSDARCLSPELHYLFKLTGPKHFGDALREKDLADVRAILPLLNPRRLADAKAMWGDPALIELPAT